MGSRKRRATISSRLEPKSVFHASQRPGHGRISENIIATSVAYGTVRTKVVLLVSVPEVALRVMV